MERLEKFEYLLGKSDGKISLNKHTLTVLNYAIGMCDILEVSDDVRKAVIASALLHDIGKIKSDFQNRLNGKYVKHVYHNIDAWAVLKTILNDNKLNLIILSAIYWHHPKPMIDENYMSNAAEILALIPKEDIDLIVEYANTILRVFEIDLERRHDSNFDSRDFRTPQFYTLDGDNSIPLLVRGILISADRISSQHNTIDDVEKIINNKSYCESYLNNLDSKELWEIKKPITYDDVRFDGQLSVVSEISNNNTAIIKAPAGYGKTDVGIMCAAKSNKKILWITPRNTVADSVYSSLVDDLKQYGLEDVSVELYLTSERKDCTNDTIPVFDSQIVVTNIDNFLFPTVKNSLADRQFTIYSRFVVFDEFHELIQDSALFAGFINIMKLRHRHTNSKTLLLSATPTLVNDMWDFGDKTTCIYPDKETHLPAVHDKQYEINIKACTLEKFIETIKTENKRNSLVTTNSLANSQIIFNDTKSDVLIHSKFNEKDFVDKKDQIFARYGKYPTTNIDFRVVSTPIFEASMNLSFQRLYNIINSPETVLQIIGRCDRWGNLSDCVINLFKITNNRSEAASKNVKYSEKLSALWADYLIDELGNKKHITLDELYIIYNKFTIKYSKEISTLISSTYNTSLENLCKMYPRRYDDDDEVNSGNSGKSTNINEFETLRGNNSGAIYFICPIYNTNEFTEPKSENYNKYDYYETREQHFQEDSRTLINVIKAIKKVAVKYKYSKNFIKGNFNMGQMETAASNSDKPYIAVNWWYDSEFGVIMNKTIGEFHEESKFVSKNSCK
jgi:CRISPR-associated endonuclease Cas3-HD